MMGRDGGFLMNSRGIIGWFVRLAVLALFFPSLGRANPDDKGASLYKAKCAGCHGTSGKGDSPAGKNMGVLSFSDPKVAAKSDADLKGTIEKGKGRMPAYGKSLKPEEIEGLLAYIRSLK